MLVMTKVRLSIEKLNLKEKSLAVTLSLTYMFYCLLLIYKLAICVISRSACYSGLTEVTTDTTYTTDRN